MPVVDEMAANALDKLDQVEDLDQLIEEAMNDDATNKTATVHPEY